MGGRAGQTTKRKSRPVQAGQANQSERTTAGVSSPAVPLLDRLEAHKHVWVPLALVLGLLALYLQSLPYDFINYDTNHFIHDNPHVRSGLSLANVRWAFSTVYGGYWMPLTWLSHMLDCSLYGLRQPWGHHLSSLLLHIANTLLLLWTMRRLTGSFWRSALVAGIFAFHPQRVESVVWIAERKDVLSALFWILTLLAYNAYARAPRFSAPRYALVALMLVLGLCSKPSVVTLPCLLLVLDFWPLRRWPARLAAESSGEAPPARPASLPVLILEKAPLLLIAIAVAKATFSAQDSFDIVMPLPLAHRLANVPVHYAAYLGKLIWPFSLAVLYPLPHQMPPAGAVLGASALLLAITAVCLGNWLRRPWLLAGWCWFLGVLVPMIGIVQVYIASIADRYTYLSQIGLGIILAWGAGAMAARWADWRRGVAVGAGLILGLLMVRTAWHVPVWRSEMTLWTQASRVTQNNDLAYMNLSGVYREQGNLWTALALARKAVDASPRDGRHHANLGRILNDLGQPLEAIKSYQVALSLRPNDAKVISNLGVVYASMGQLDEALAKFNEALRLDADDVHSYCNLGSAYATKGDPARAVAYFEQALKRQPDCFDAVYNLGLLAREQGDPVKALGYLEKAAALAPGDPDPPYQIGLIHALQGDRARAAESFRAALPLAQRMNNAELAGEIQGALAGLGRQ